MAGAVGIEPTTNGFGDFDSQNQFTYQRHQNAFIGEFC